MANRSDFFSAKLPRYLKRMLIAGSKGDKHQDAVVRKLFVNAHAHHVDVKKYPDKYKLAGLNSNTNVSTEEND